MTTLTIDLPDHVANEAKAAGLLSPEALTQLLTEAMRRQAGRQLLELAKRIQAEGIAPMTDEEIVAEVKAVRAARHARQAKADDARRS